MRKFDFLVLLVFSLLLALPIFLNITSTFPRLDTDYDSSLPIYSYMVHFIWRSHSLPLVIPFVARGIPVLGDPLNSFLNPLLSVPLLIFGINVGLRFSILLNILFSGISMFFLLRSVQTRKTVQIFGSLLYMSSGAIVAQIAAGHIEKMLIYPLTPLLLLFSLRARFYLKESLAIALIIAATIYSGDLYATWFFILFFLTIRTYYFFSEKRLSNIIFPIVSLFGSIAFGVVKLYPFFFTVLPMMQRYFPINPYQGSVHFFLLPLFFVIPFQVSFYDRPFFQHHLGFSFNWYEYYAFLSSFPFVFLLGIKQIWKTKLAKILVALLIIGGLYVSLGFFYSPFYWLYHLVPSIPFRVPQRIILPLTSVVVLLVCICADYFLKKKILQPKIVSIIFVCSVIWTTVIFWQTLIQTFPKNLVLQPEIINQVAILNQKKDPVVTFVPETQFFLTENNIPIANYYYGWIPQDTEIYLKNNSYDFARLLNTKPHFVLTNPYTTLIPYGYTNVLKNATIAVWKRG